MGNNSSRPDERFPVLSESDSAVIAIHYEVVVIGSGYGGGVAASRAARAGRNVCLLEQGREWRPGEFPKNINEGAKQIKVKWHGQAYSGTGLELYDINNGDGVSVLRGCGLGGTSLINANVWFKPEPEALEHPCWPLAFRRDKEDFYRLDVAHAEEMLRPSPYPKDPTSYQRMREVATALHEDNGTLLDIEELDGIFKRAKDKKFEDLFYKVPLTINFKDQAKNHVGQPQPVCNGCGNCCGGCNTGAKSTVNMTYLPDAKYHGAHIYTKVRVVSLQRTPNAKTWSIFYQRFHNDAYEEKLQIVTADVVILGASSLGSTEILQRSRKDNGLALSPTLGKGFSGNGDLLGFAYNGEKPAGCVGVNYKKPGKDPPGPTISSVLDMRSVPGEDWEDGFILEDGGAPSSAQVPFRAVLALAPLIQTDDIPEDDLDQVVNALQGKALDNTLSMLGMSYDDKLGEDGKRTTGELVLDEDDDGVMITWPNAGAKKNFKLINQGYRVAAKALRGSFVPFLPFTDVLAPFKEGGKPMTVHPLGGCCMGETGLDGVVNHKGQVFTGEGTEVYDGLYVTDGSILPHSVAVNPFFTISSCAERIMRLMAVDRNWGPIDYDFVAKPSKIDLHRLQKPGVRMVEWMSGEVVSPDGDTAQMVVEIANVIMDLEEFVDHPTSHTALIDGTIECSMFSDKPMTVKGNCQLFVPDETNPRVKNTWYRLTMWCLTTNKTFFLLGKKVIEKDEMLEFGIGDQTKLSFEIYEGLREGGNIVGEGHVETTLSGIIKSMRGLKIINCRGGYLSRAKLEMKFYSLYYREIQATYSSLSQKTSFNLSGTPRQKRNLNIPSSATPEVYRTLTPDDYIVYLTRYRGGQKGPVLLIHGLGVSSGMFTLDTVKMNLVEFLVAKSYDVWLVDWRGSGKSRYRLSEFSFDEVAKYDIPCAVKKILDTTKQKDLQVVAHGIGAIAFFGSMLSGKLKHMIRSACVSQVSFLPTGGSDTKIKAALHLPELAARIGMDPDKTQDSGWLNSFIAQGMSDLLTPDDEEVKNPVLHRITFLFGRQWQIRNLNRATAENMHELFDAVNVKAHEHLARIVNKGHLVDKKGKSTYLPELSKGEASESLVEHIKRLDIPITFIHGSKNDLFVDTGINNAIALLQSINKEQKYSMVQLKDFSHLDVFIGQFAHTMCFPKILDVLDENAHCDTAGITRYAKRVSGILNKYHDTAGEAIIQRSTAHTVMAEAGEVHHPMLAKQQSDLEKLGDVNAVSDSEDEGDDMEKQISSMELNNALPYEIPVVYKRKSRADSQRPYEPPEMVDGEELFVVPVVMTEDQVKRDIYVLSDTHFGSESAKDIDRRIRPFMQHLLSAAHEVHTFVMNGDVLEMWYGHMDDPPLTIDEWMEWWTSGDVNGLDNFRQAVRRLAEEKGVKVYYVRGNHDHEMTEWAVKHLFGEKVMFIPGVLIYEVSQGDAIYRVRMQHGHDWDIFNGFSLGEENLINKKPIGFFVARCAHTGQYKCGNVSHFILDVVPSILEKIKLPSESGMMRVLSTCAIQRMFTRTLLESALNGALREDEQFVLDKDGTFVTAKNLFNYSYIKETIKKYGANRAAQMLRQSAGDFTEFVSSCDEDVVIVGHSHRMACQNLPGRRGDVIYANCGAWIEEGNALYSYVKVTVPWVGAHGGNGIVEINYRSAEDVEDVPIPDV